MMKRLPSDLFDDLYGSEMLHRFNPALREREIESAYIQFYSKSSKASIYTAPRNIPAIHHWKATETDGLMECTYKNELFYFMQETKWKHSHTELGLKQQLIQPIMYKWLLDEHKSGHNIRGTILNSEKYIGYVFYDEIEDFVNRLYEIFPTIKENPCQAYKNPKIRELIDSFGPIDFHFDLVTDKYALHKTLKNIYKHCL